jgi:hypothetical protein
MVNSYTDCYSSTECGDKKCVKISGNALIKKHFFEKKALSEKQKRDNASETQERMIKNCKEGCCHRLDKGWVLVDPSEEPESGLAKQKSFNNSTEKKKEN